MNRTSVVFAASHRLILVGAALCALASTAIADERGVCASNPPKSGAILACTRIIAAPRTSPHDRALALAFRANAKRAGGDNAGAIADFDEILKLNPQDPLALYSRGIAKRANGDATGGDADIAAAKAIKPGIGDQP